MERRKFHKKGHSLSMRYYGKRQLGLRYPLEIDYHPSSSFVWRTGWFSGCIEALSVFMVEIGLSSDNRMDSNE